MKLPRELVTVTKTSKILAAVIFITLPFLGFFVGTNYQSSLDSASQTTANEPILVKRAPTPTPSPFPKIVSNKKTSPDGSFIVTEQTLADTQIITVKNKEGQVIAADLIKKNAKGIGYNVKFRCQCGTSFKGWISNTEFIIKIVNGGGEEYEYTVNAVTGRIDESTFKRIK